MASPSETSFPQNQDLYLTGDPEIDILHGPDPYYTSHSAYSLITSIVYSPGRLANLDLSLATPTFPSCSPAPSVELLFRSCPAIHFPFIMPEEDDAAKATRLDGENKALAQELAELKASLARTKKNTRQVVETAQNNDEDEDEDYYEDAPRPREVPPPTLAEVDGIKFTTFSRQFKRVAELNQWSERRAILMLQTSMQDAAARAVDHIIFDEASSLTDAIKDYTTVFVNPASAQLHKSKFRDSCRHPGEDLIVWHTRVRELFMRAFPTITDLETNDDLKEKFVLGLRNRQLSHSLLSAENFPSTSFSQLLTRSQNLQGSLLQCQKSYSDVSAISGKPANVNAMGPASGKKSTTVVCYYCGRQGHVVNECRTKVRDQQQGKTSTFGRGGSSNSGATPGYRGSNPRGGPASSPAWSPRPNQPPRGRGRGQGRGRGRGTQRPRGGPFQVHAVSMDESTAPASTDHESLPPQSASATDDHSYQPFDVPSFSEN